MNQLSENNQIHCNLDITIVDLYFFNLENVNKKKVNYTQENNYKNCCFIPPPATLDCQPVC